MVIERTIPKEKTCTKCKETKPAAEFPRKQAYRDGLSSWCRECTRKSTKEAIKKRPAYYSEFYRRYYREVAKKRGYKSPNKAANDRKYREKNKEKLTAKRRERKKERLLSDVKYRLDERVRHSIWKALRENKAGRRWEEMVGYTVNELHRHLSKTMPPGYSWGDYLSGKLQIDHIIPRCAFNYETHTDIDFNRCWSLKNLRLLTKEDNYEKRGRIDKPFQPSLRFSRTTTTRGWSYA